MTALAKRLPWDRPARQPHTHPHGDKGCDVLEVEGHLANMHGWTLDAFGEEITAGAFHALHDQIHEAQDA